MTIKKGFTLGEVLITLGILGLIAAVVTPTLSTSVQNAQNRARFQKSINSLSNAVSVNVMTENFDFSQTDSTGKANGDMSIYNIFAKRLEISKAEEEGGTTGNYTLFFKDGFSITFPKNASGCTPENRCRGIVDVNGKATPNVMAACDNGDQANCKVTKSADRYPVAFYDDVVIPNSAAARAVMFKARKN